MRQLFLILIILIAGLKTYAGEENKQEIKGKVIDRVSQQPLSGATLSITAVTKTIGTLSDVNGEFTLWNIPSDIQTLIVTLQGYKDIIIENPLRLIEKGLLLTIEMDNRQNIKKKFLAIRFFKDKHRSSELSLVEHK